MLIDPNFYSSLTALATVILFCVAWKQLEKISKQTRADFLFRFDREFFGNKKNQKIIRSIEEKEKLLKQNGGKFDEYDLDDYLGYFNMMKKFVDEKLINFKFIDDSFGHYIVRAWENEEIKIYIRGLRVESNDYRYYESFEIIAKRIINKERKIRV